jgi:hypothetical protein
MTRSWHSFLLALALGLTVGCAASPSTPPAPTRIALESGRIALPDHEPCVVANATLCVDTGTAMFGTLHERDGCISILRDNGEEARIVWPFGYSAQMSPLAIFDNTGRLVAQGGDRLRGDGAGPFTGSPDSCGRGTYVVLNDPVR